MTLGHGQNRRRHRMDRRKREGNQPCGTGSQDTGTRFRVVGGSQAGPRFEVGGVWRRPRLETDGAGDVR